MNIPKLRFKEFTDEWKHYSLDDIISISSKKYNPLTSNISYPCIELESILSNSGTVINTFDSLNQKSIKNVFKENDILFGKLRPYLKKYWYAKFNGVCSSEIWVLNNKLGLNKYLYYLIQTNKFNLIANNSTGSKMPRADWQFIKSQKFYISNMLEQEKIANFLTTVDKKIENLANTITSLENQKKGLLQQIFSQKLRFKDKNGNNYPIWEKKKLNEISDVSSGKRIPKGMQFPSIGKTFYITVSDMSENFVSPLNINTISDDIENIIKKYKVFTGDIIISVAGTLGKINLITPLFNNANLTENCDRISNFKKVYNLYIFYFLKSNIIQETIKKSSTLSSQPKLALERIRNFNILLPCLEEQTKIADFLSAFDRKLENQKTQLEHWQQIKKGLLQQMFV